MRKYLFYHLQIHAITQQVAQTSDLQADTA